MKVGFGVGAEQFQWHRRCMEFDSVTIAAQLFPMAGPGAWQKPHGQPNVSRPTSYAWRAAHNDAHRHRDLPGMIRLLSHRTALLSPGPPPRVFDRGLLRLGVALSSKMAREAEWH